MKIVELIISAVTVIIGYFIKVLKYIYNIIIPPLSKINSMIKNAVAEGNDPLILIDKDGNQYQFATLSQRLIAHLIDYGVLLIPMGITVLIFPFFAPFLALAFNVAFWSTRGATPGKKFMRLIIIDVDGNYLTVERSIIRYLGYFISGIFFTLGHWWVYWDPYNQGWHDKFAKSFVVIENH